MSVFYWYSFILYSYSEIGDFMYKLQKANIQLQSKQYFWLLILGGIAILGSLIYLFFLDSVNKKIVTDSIYAYFTYFKSGEYQAFSFFLNSLGNNLFFVISIWILGISMIGIPIVFLLYIIKYFLFGFSLFGIFQTFGIKGIFKAFIYVFPFKLLFILGLTVLTFHSLYFAFHLCSNLFHKKTYHLHQYMIRYSKLFLFFLILAIIDSLWEAYLLPNFLF